MPSEAVGAPKQEKYLPGYLDRAQIAGIVHLVSSSVPELDPKAVSVLDQSGALLSGGVKSPLGIGEVWPAERLAGSLALAQPGVVE